VTAVLNLSLIIGSGDGGVPLAIGLLVAMGASGLAAWYADRMAPATGRRMMWAAFVVFFVLGVISVFTVGVLYLMAAVLSIFSLSRSQPERGAGDGV
jgi:peptidoglycan biosynthesis protein MviN/MurJ (putative lipid II flippase)